MTNQEMIKEFHDIYEVDPEERQDISFKLIDEEFYEVAEELGRPDKNWATDINLHTSSEVDKEKLAKELADLLYVSYGTAEVFDIDLDKAFELVHKSNMSKLGEDRKPIRREDGKILKGPNYSPPDMSKAIIDV